MKKILSVVLALVMMLSLSAVAFADAADEVVHNGTLPAESSQDVKITINGLHAGGADDGKNLPSEYHVRVKWDVENGVYNATATDGKDDFQNFSWNCTSLEYEVNTYTGTDGADVRSGNWATTPKVAFEVTNASTPDKPIKIAASMAANGWASLLKAASLEDQNSTFGTVTVAPVLIANMGTGVNSYEEGVVGTAAHNVEGYTYVLNWDYDALNTLALASLKNNSATTELTATFVVTITTP